MTFSSSSTQFDYIIIGGGTAGLVVASRLSEDKTKSVLVIEAGQDCTGEPRIDTPGLLTSLYGDPNFDWEFLSEPQSHVNGRQIPQPRGRVLGGSSALNFSLIMYPSKEDFEMWVALGNEGWGAVEMSPYLRKFHTYASPDDDTANILDLNGYMDKKQQGSQGPLPVGFPSVYGAFNKAWDETFAALGWRDGMDPINGKKLGTFTAPLSVNAGKGTRGYAVAYYNLVAHRPNLTLWTQTQVEKILGDYEDGGKFRANSVKVRSSHGHDLVTARCEVILSAGSLHSPQILELSGIGSSKRLQNHGIPTLIDLPGVGENLQDHCIASVSYKVDDSQVSGDVMRAPEVVQSLLKLYQETKGGPLSGMPISVAYLPPVDNQGSVPLEKIQRLVGQYLDQDLNNNKDIPLGQPDQSKLLRQLLLNGQEPTAEYMFLPSQLHTDHSTMAGLFDKSAEGNYISILAMLSHPFSRGSVHVRSKDIQDKPIFDPNYLSHPFDLEILARHTQFVDRVAHAEPFQSLLQPECRIPGTEDTDFSDLESVKAMVKDRLFTCFHPAGTCAMMPAGLGGVVDAQLKVHGTHNLRVVDASVIPLLPQGNIQATVYAIAEKAADLIRKENGQS